MKKVSKAMYGKSMMNDGGKVGPIEGIKLRMQAAKEARKRQKNEENMREYRNNQKSKPEMNFPNPYPPKCKKGMVVKTKYKTGGMVNANTKVSADKTPGSKGVMSGENPKVSASKVAKGRSGGTSKAPKTATPKAMYGMSMKPGMMKMGGTKKK